MNRGKSAVKSQPALIELAEMFVPIWAMINAKLINQTYVQMGQKQECDVSN